MRVVEELTAHGHLEIRATHPTTLEVTRDRSVTPRGDCIVAVNASKSTANLSEEFKDTARNPRTRITMTLQVEGAVEVIRGHGHPNLTFTHPTDIVVRKSTYVCPRTLMVGADRAAADLRRETVSKLKNPESQIIIRLVARL